MNMIFDEPFYINDEPFYRNKQHLFKQSLKAKPRAGINHSTFPDTLPYDKMQLSICSFIRWNVEMCSNL